MESRKRESGNQEARMRARRMETGSHSLSLRPLRLISWVAGGHRFVDAGGWIRRQGEKRSPPPRKRRSASLQYWKSLEAALNGPGSDFLHQREDDEDDRDHDQHVNERTQNVEADPTNQPENEKYDCNSPEHVNVSPFATASVVNRWPSSRRVCRFPLEIRSFRQTYRCFETPVQSFPRAPLSETEAHFCFHHHARLRLRGHARA